MYINISKWSIYHIWCSHQRIIDITILWFRPRNMDLLPSSLPAHFTQFHTMKASNIKDTQGVSTQSFYSFWWPIVLPAGLISRTSLCLWHRILVDNMHHEATSNNSTSIVAYLSNLGRKNIKTEWTILQGWPKPAQIGLPIAESRNQGPEIVASTGRSIAARQANLRWRNGGSMVGKDINYAIENESTRDTIISCILMIDHDGRYIQYWIVTTRICEHMPVLEKWLMLDC